MSAVASFLCCISPSIVCQTMTLLMCRADNIVRDAEAVRMVLVPPDAPGGGKWSLLGQSFGGFCAVRSCQSRRLRQRAKHEHRPVVSGKWCVMGFIFHALRCPGDVHVYVQVGTG
jgi:hypothetical protein